VIELDADIISKREDDRLKIGCVIMAAGRSSRFGRNKLLEEIGGKSLICRALESVPAEMLYKTVVVTGYPEIKSQAEERGFSVVRNERPEDGISLSIRLGLNELQDVDAVMFVVCDQPYLKRQSVAAALESYLEHPDQILSMSNNGRRGNPCIFPSALFPELLKLEGDVGGSAVIRKHDELMQLFEVAEVAELEDVDHEADLVRNLVVVRGGGDIATGTIHKLHRSGFPVIVLEVRQPTAIRRAVAFSEAVYDSQSEVEGLVCRLADTAGQAISIIRAGEIAMMVDEHCGILKELKPWALVDAIMAKKNLGTNRGMAGKTIALGPGFTAGKDVDIVIETMRGHDLGRIIESGEALENTGIPGLVEGLATERVIYAKRPGSIRNTARIGENVTKGQTIAVICRDEEEHPVTASIDGLLRGILRDGSPVREGMKIADIDPRAEERNNCFTISDKARCIAGSVLEALMYLERPIDNC